MPPLGLGPPIVTIHFRSQKAHADVRFWSMPLIKSVIGGLRLSFRGFGQGGVPFVDRPLVGGRC
jgi:hypothetical protein